MTLTDQALILGSTMRLTRLIVTDDWGQWLIVDPIEKRFDVDRNRSDPLTPAEKAATMLSCPFCVGYWLGVGVLASYHLTGASPKARRAWRFVAATLTLNEVAAHLGVRLGDAG